MDYNPFCDVMYCIFLHLNLTLPNYFQMCISIYINMCTYFAKMSLVLSSFWLYNIVATLMCVYCFVASFTYIYSCSIRYLYTLIYLVLYVILFLLIFAGEVNIHRKSTFYVFIYFLLYTMKRRCFNFRNQYFFLCIGIVAREAREL